MEYYDATNTAVRVTIGTYNISGTTISITDIGYTLVGGEYVPDASAGTTTMTINKFNGSELDVTLAGLSANLNKTSIALPAVPTF